MADEEKEKILCYRCGYQAEKGDKHCVLCGAPLENRCMDEPGLVHKGCGYKNEPHAAFCVKCGHPTTFNHHGIVTPHPLSKGGGALNPLGGLPLFSGGAQNPFGGAQPSSGGTFPPNQQGPSFFGQPGPGTF